jgi:hypothetical protein
MPDTLDVDALMAAAAEAAGQQDPATAVRFLRRALDLQVTSIGPDHRDLAPTLNNLALMLERQGKPDEAEQCYRRAYDIARRGARPNDPLVLVSRANLLAFLQAVGVKNPDLDEPAAVPVNARAPEPAAEPPPPLQPPPPPAAKRSLPPSPVAAPRPRTPPAQRSTAPAPPRASAAPRTAPPAPSSAPGRGWTIAGLAAVGAVTGAVASWLFLAPPQANRTQPPVAQAAPVEPRTSPRPPESTEPTAPAPPAASSPQKPPQAADPPAAQTAPPTTGGNDAQPAPPAAAEAPAASAEGLTADTRLCAALIRTTREWRCDAVATPVDSDAVYYYTRVRTARDAVMRHQWSYQGEVVRTVNLEVRANAETGFRTFSRQTVSGRGAGSWEVALIAPDGAVIDTQRFAVEDRR